MSTADSAQPRNCSNVGPRPLTKEGLVSNVGILGCAESTRSLDLKLSCDIKVVPHGTRMCRPDKRRK